MPVLLMNKGVTNKIYKIKVLIIPDVWEDSNKDRYF